MAFEESLSQLATLGVGLSYRGPLRSLLTDPHVALDCVEVVADQLVGPDFDPPPELISYPILVHALELSLGSSEPLDDDYLRHLHELCSRLDALWVSDHLGATRSEELDFGTPVPVAPSRANISRIAGKIREIQEATDRLFLLENVPLHLCLGGDVPWFQLLAEVSEAADCGVLLDVAAFSLSARGRDLDPFTLLDELPLRRVIELHVSGLSTLNGRPVADKRGDISAEVFELARAVLERAEVRAVVLERDGLTPPLDVVRGELARLRADFAGSRPAAEGAA